jgi:hypothetical protein
MLSARPQVWLSKPVDWLFETDADEMRIDKLPQDGRIRIWLAGLAENTRRAKEFGRSPMPVPIQSDIFFSTLSDVESTEMRVVVIVADDGGKASSFTMEISANEVVNSDLVIEGSVTENQFLVDELVGAVVGKPGLQVWLSMDKCPPRESRVSCPFADFSHTDLSKGDFELANLRGADFTGATMIGSKLGGADLSGSILFGADLSHSWLVSVDIDQAFLDDTVFTDAVWTR